MSNLTSPLRSTTDPNWAAFIIKELAPFLADHANCERKASAFAMSMVARYPDRQQILPRLIALAREELDHFEQVYQIMANRGIALAPDRKDPYVNQLLAQANTQGEARLLDRLLISGLIEARGAERFGLLSEALQEPQLKQFYQVLGQCEGRHYHLFIEMAGVYFPPEQITHRLAELAEHEAEIVSQLVWRPSLH